MGIEPTTSAWKAEVIPLYDGRLKMETAPIFPYFNRLAIWKYYKTVKALIY